MNARRQTLGGLSASQLNTRTANGGAVRVETVKKRTSLAGPISHEVGTTPGRKNGSSRRSSIFGWSQASKVDPRPLNDKQYLNSCIRTLITYLSTHGYENAVSPKMLMSPTSKDFVHIVTFLFRKVDSSLKIVGKMEEEVPQIFKKLKYPFPMSRSSLYAVGSPHSWPSLLAALTWLAELLNYEEKAAEIQSKPFDFESDDTSGLFFDFVSQSYQSFLCGDDNHCFALEEDLRAKFQEKDSDISSAISRYEKENAELKQTIDEFSTKPSPLQTLQQKKSDLADDLSKFHTLIKKLKEHKETVEAKTREKEEELRSKEEELKVIEAEKQELEAIVSNQSMNKKDVAKMMQEKTKLQDILSSLTNQKDSLYNAALDGEARIERKIEDLESTSRLYHATADRLQLIPSTAKHAEGLNFQIKLNTDADSPSEIMAVDIKGTLKPTLNNLKETYMKKTRTVTDEMLEVQEKLDSLEEVLTEKGEENSAMELQNKKVESQVKELKESTDNEIASKNAQAERLKSEFDTLRQTTISSYTESEAQTQALRNEYEELCKVCNLETEMVNKELAAALEALIAHKLHIQQTLKRVEEQTRNHLEDLTA